MDRAKKCPKVNCENYIHGRECSMCGTNPEKEDIVTCRDGGNRVLKDDCQTDRQQDGVTGKWKR